MIKPNNTDWIVHRTTYTRSRIAYVCIIRISCVVRKMQGGRHMAVHEYDRNKIKEEMRNRLEKCIRQLLELENILLGDKRATHCHAEA